MSAKHYYCLNCGIEVGGNHGYGCRPTSIMITEDTALLRHLEERNRQLATLRSEVAYVRGRLESYARALEGWNVGAEVEIATALREDARRLEKLGGGDRG